MKKIFLSSTLFLLVLGSSLYAATVTVSDAQNVALNFFKVNNPDDGVRSKLTATLKYTKTEADNTVDFYVFDISPAKGFVIVAGDDNVVPILGYSTESNFSTNFKKIGLNHWVKRTAANIRLALQHNVVADARISNKWAAYRQGLNPGTEKSTSIAPMCLTTWDQENDISANGPPPYLYNLLCPYNNHDQQRCLTGCVATAQAQVMRYWNYPAKGTGSYSYLDNYAYGETSNYGTQSSNFAAHSYEWSLMPPVLTGQEPLAQDLQVDTLMYDVAVSVGMAFGDDNQDGSGAEAVLSIELYDNGDSICSQYALAKYFSYNPATMQGVLETDYTASGWITLIENELNAGRPVMYEGDDNAQDTSGHCWVCDGYDGNDFFHMNWGWSALDDGYFAVNNLTTSGDFDPVNDEDALIGIEPKYPRAPLTGFAATYTSTCSGIIQFNDYSQDMPTSWLWNFGDGITSTEQNPLHTYTSNGTYSVTLTATNPAGSNAYTISNYITVDILQAPSVTVDSTHTLNSFSLAANTTSPVTWFDSAGAVISNSNPFVTHVLTHNTTYYIQDTVMGASYNVGPASDQSGKDYYTDPADLQFNVIKPCIIKSVYVYALTSATRNIQVLDSAYNVVAQTAVNCPAGGSRLTLNFSLSPGNSYYMQVGTIGDTIDLYSNGTGVSYPYNDAGGLVSITGNTAYDPTTYFYFYDWIVDAPSCISERAKYTVDTVSAPADTIHVSGINILTNNSLSFSMYPNPAADEVVLQANVNGQELTWYVKNILGQTLLSQTTETGQTRLNLDNFANGVYLVQLQMGDKSIVKRLVVNR